MKKFYAVFFFPFWGFSIRVVFLLVLVRQPIGIIKPVLIEVTITKNYYVYVVI